MVPPPVSCVRDRSVRQVAQSITFEWYMYILNLVCIFGLKETYPVSQPPSPKEKNQREHLCVAVDSHVPCINCLVIKPFQCHNS